MPSAPHPPRCASADSPAAGDPVAGALETCRGAARALHRGGAADASLSGWVELIPPGEARTRDGRGPFRLSDPAAVVNAFAVDYPPGSDQAAPVDYDHADLQRDAGDDLTPAAGWLAELRVSEGGGIEGRIEWTARASAMIAAREIRYISPELLVDPESGEIVGISGAGLTHRPNLFLRALSHRARPPALEPQMDELAERLRYMLNLPVTSTAAEIAEHLSRLIERLGAESAPMTEAGLLPQGATPADALVLMRQMRDRVDDLGAHLLLPASADPAEVLAQAQTTLSAIGQERETQSAALETLRTELGLTPPAGVQTMTAADIATAAVARVRTLESAAAERDAREAVAAAMRDRLIEPAKREWAEGYARRDPQGFTAYLKTCTPIIAPRATGAPLAGAAAASDFEGLVAAAMAEQGVTRGTAMMRVARVHPEAHRAWIESTQPQALRA